MSAPVFAPISAPPLPPGWTEYTAPSGHLYYYNAQTGESTYVRPLPSFRDFPPPQAQQKKKEKPLVKTSIPGTDWIRVKTTEGNVFYTHVSKKGSVWSVPEEIMDALSALEAQERLDETGSDSVTELEIERVKAEVQEMVKRKAEDAVPGAEMAGQKKAKLASDAGEESDDGNTDEEDWQREAAVQLAKEEEEHRRRLDEEEKRANEEAMKEKEEKEVLNTKAKELNMPSRVDLSLDEAKALFMTLLREKDINPFHPWDTSLPLFIADPRYVLLPSVSVRREVFDEYCRDRARELRKSTVKKEKEAANPKEAFDRLLKDEVTSTRMTWTEFRRTWKKDRRFWGWGRDDREREKAFRDHVKDLGEKKRKAARNAEADFFLLLRESDIAKAGSAWKEVKGMVSSDPRYDAVGSASLREELFETFLKANATAEAASNDEEPLKLDATRPAKDEQDDAREKKEKAIKDRLEKVKAQRDRVEAEIGRSRVGLNREEGERTFRNMLTDAVRDPQATWDRSLPQLKKDPRFTLASLPVNQQVHLFHAYVEQLRSKYQSSLAALFETHAPSLASPFSSLPIPSLLTSLPVTKLGLDIGALEAEFERWQRGRTTQARNEFDQMLGESSFIEFWGRLRKIGGEGVEGGIKADDLGEDEGEGGGGKVDMKQLAKTIDVEEIEKVLKNDKRYIVFDHLPQQRERWIQDYLSGLSAPKLSVHTSSPT